MCTANRFLAFLFIVLILGTISSIRNVEAAVYAPASGRTLYVSSSGSDANGCTSSAPCREIRRALTLVQTGDLISVADGSFLGFNVEDKHGTALAPIVIQASGSAANITVSKDRGVDNRDNIFVVDSSYVIVNGLRTSGASRAGMRISVSQHIIVSGGVFANNRSWGIFTDFADDLILEDNEASGSVTQHGIYVSNSSQRPIIRRNRVFDNTAAGVQINADVSMGGPGITEGALIERNLIYGNGAKGAAGINLDGVHNSIIRNNLIYNNRGIGITAFLGDGASGPRGNLIANNTIVQPGNGRVSLQISSSTGVNTVRNNVLIHLGSRAGLELVDDSDVNFTDSNNNIVDRIGFPDGSVLALAAVKSSPAYRHLDPDSLSATVESLFIDVATSNYDLLDTAPAVDRGVNLTAVTNDYADRERSQGLSSDIGAFAQSASPQATFTNAVLTLPKVKVGTKIYNAKLAYVGASSPPEFQLTTASILTTPEDSFTSNFENGGLVIPSVKVGAVTYRVELTLVDPVLLKFRLKTAVPE